MRSEWKPKGEIVHLLGALMPENRLACELSLHHGLRIGDVLKFVPEKVRKQRFTIREEKTGKSRKISLSNDEVARCLACSGAHYVFEHRTDGKRSRTRQAVYKDLKRVARLFRCSEQISPHSMRKIYAVEQYAKYGDLKKVQKLLNHSSEAVTMLYAMADCVDKRREFKKELTKKESIVKM